MVEWSRIGKYSIYFNMLVLDRGLDRLRPWVEAGIVILLAAQEGGDGGVDGLAGYACDGPAIGVAGGPHPTLPT